MDMTNGGRRFTVAALRCKYCHSLSPATSILELVRVLDLYFMLFQLAR